MIVDDLKELIKRAAKVDRPNLDLPPKSTWGDLTTDCAFELVVDGKKVAQIADKIKENLVKSPLIAKVDIVGGHLNLWLADKFWQEFWLELKKEPGLKNQTEAGQKIVVDYSGPNIGKPFSVGHLRSTVIGDCVANLNQNNGAQVIRINHLGDFGTQFGKLMVAIKRFGDEQKIAQDPIKELLALYVKFHQEAERNPQLIDESRQWFKKLENKDEAAVKIWQKIVIYSMKEYDKLYKILNIKFDLIKGESAYQDQSEEIVSELKEKKLVKTSEGAQVVVFPEHNLPSTIIQKSDGASVYLTRDLAALKDRLIKMKADKIIYHIGVEQSLHFEQLFTLAGLLGWIKPEEVEVRLMAATHGLYRLETGKMSTRSGRGVLLADLVKQGKSKVAKLLAAKNPELTDKKREELALQIAISAIKYNDLSHNRKSAIIFNWDQALNLEGNSAVYLIYTLARLNGIFRQAKVAKAEFIKELPTPLFGEKEKPLWQGLVSLELKVRLAAQLASPHLLAESTFKLARLFNTYYSQVKILADDQKERSDRLALTYSIKELIKDSLALLGITTYEQL